VTRLGFDGITPASVPAGAAIYLGYVNGSWPSFAALKAQHPGKLYVSISVNATGRAQCLDVEKGDATPQQAPGWVKAQRAAGNHYPIVYCNESTWPTVKAEFTAQNVAAPLYWVARYVADPSKVGVIPAGAIGVQDYDFGGYDRSQMADYIPGLDPAPVAPPVKAPVPSTLEGDMDWTVLDAPIAANTTTRAMYLYTGATVVHIPGAPADPDSYNALQKKYGVTEVDWPFFDNVIKSCGAGAITA
jgi:hypothetical protein